MKIFVQLFLYSFAKMIFVYPSAIPVLVCFFRFKELSLRKGKLRMLKSFTDLFFHDKKKINKYIYFIGTVSFY